MRILIVFFLTTIMLFGQNKIIIDERTEKPMAVGYGERSLFSDTSFVNWFENEYSAYKVNELDEVVDKLTDVNITIVLGTWCSDSRREIPRFLKILDQLEFPEEKIKLIFVDRKKKGIENEVEGLNIEYVPTIIFYRDGNEIGRIVESPDETLEEDLTLIVE